MGREHRKLVSVGFLLNLVEIANPAAVISL